MKAPRMRRFHFEYLASMCDSLGNWYCGRGALYTRFLRYGLIRSKLYWNVRLALYKLQFSVLNFHLMQPFDRRVTEPRKIFIDPFIHSSVRPLSRPSLHSSFLPFCLPTCLSTFIVHSTLTFAHFKVWVIKCQRLSQVSTNVRTIT